MKIAIDLDNTLINTPLSIINLHNKLNKNKIPYMPNCDWKMKPMIKTDEELSKLFKLFDDKNFYKNDTLIVYDNAIDIVNELSMQNYICIISKHDIMRRSITRKWVYETFPTTDLVFTDNFEDKGNILKGLGFDIILDDRIDALENCTDVAYKICYGNYDWNASWTGLRITSWLEFKEFIDKIQKLDKNKLR